MTNLLYMHPIHNPAMKHALLHHHNSTLNTSAEVSVVGTVIIVTGICLILYLLFKLSKEI